MLQCTEITNIKTFTFWQVARSGVMSCNLAGLGGDDGSFLVAGKPAVFTRAGGKLGRRNRTLPLQQCFEIGTLLSEARKL
jgi:hypothetical protein